MEKTFCVIVPVVPRGEKERRCRRLARIVSEHAMRKFNMTPFPKEGIAIECVSPCLPEKSSRGWHVVLGKFFPWLFSFRRKKVAVECPETVEVVFQDRVALRNANVAIFIAPWPDGNNSTFIAQIVERRCLHIEGQGDAPFPMIVCVKKGMLDEGLERILRQIRVTVYYYNTTKEMRDYVSRVIANIGIDPLDAAA
jgi:hypothetical protein